VHSPLILISPNADKRKSSALSLAHNILLSSGNESTLIKLKGGSHPDLYEIAPDPKSQLYSMEEIREFIKDILLPPFEGKEKVYILHDVERMLPIHANALLKTLEEKPSYATILLTTANLRKLLPTIISRSEIKIIPQAEETNEGREKLQKQLARALEASQKGEYSSLFSIIDLLIKEHKMEELLEEYIFVMKEIEPFEKSLKKVALAEEALDRYLRPKQVLEYLFLR
jgi:DNA polymerase III delta prime subunit